MAVSEKTIKYKWMDFVKFTPSVISSFWHKCKMKATEKNVLRFDWKRWKPTDVFTETL